MMRAPVTDFVTTAAHAAGMRRRLLAISVLGLTMLLVWGRVLGYEIRRDELMFVPPAVLLHEHSLYRDFFFNHVPYSAWIFRGAERLFGDLGLLFSARLAVCAAWLVLVAAVGLTVLRLSGSGGLALICALSLMTTEGLLNQTGMAATNNLLPLAFSSVGAGLFLVATVAGPPKPAPLLLAGFCMAVAAATKISAVVLVPPLLAGAFLMPAGMPLRLRMSRVVLPLTVGGLIGGAPALAVFAADPARVFAHVVGFHTGPHVAWWAQNGATEPGVAMGLGGKIQIAHALWLGSSSLVLFVVLLFLMLIGSREQGRPGSQTVTERRALAVVAAAIAATAAMAFVPSPGFPQYYAPPLALLPFLPALAMRRLGPAYREQAAPVLLAAGLAMAVIGAPRLLPAAMTWIDLGSSTPAASAEAGSEIRERLEAEGLASGRVATLMPIYPLESGLDVYPEFATGPFAYRIAGVTGPDLAEYFVMAGPEDLAELFAADPPAAILTGFSPELEGPFLQWAQAHGYERAEALGISNRYGSATLHLAPRVQDQTMQTTRRTAMP